MHTPHHWQALQSKMGCTGPTHGTQTEKCKATAANAKKPSGHVSQGLRPCTDTMQRHQQQNPPGAHTTPTKHLHRGCSGWAVLLHAHYPSAGRQPVSCSSREAQRCKGRKIKTSSKKPDRRTNDVHRRCNTTQIREVWNWAMRYQFQKPKQGCISVRTLEHKNRALIPKPAFDTKLILTFSSS